MKKIKWYLKIKKSLELIDPSEDLAKVYMKKAEDFLRASISLRGNRDWEISSCYYTMYFSLYAILMKIGVKCEVHLCTINFMKIFLMEYFDVEDVDLIRKA